MLISNIAFTFRGSQFEKWYHKGGKGVLLRFSAFLILLKPPDIMIPAYPAVQLLMNLVLGSALQIPGCSKEREDISAINRSLSVHTESTSSPETTGARSSSFSSNLWCAENQQRRGNRPVNAITHWHSISRFLTYLLLLQYVAFQRLVNSSSKGHGGAFLQISSLYGG